MQTLAADLAQRLRAGDWLLLQGELGAGKTTFARALIRTALADTNAEVPSPTFTLVQTYETASFDILHCDLYRLSDVSELEELGLFHATTAVRILEWPDRLGAFKPPSFLEVELSGVGDTRKITLRGTGRDWPQKLDGLL